MPARCVVKLVTVVGARPQFIKAAAVARAITSHNAAHPDRPVHEDALTRGAALSGAQVGRFEDRIDGVVEVRVVEHDEGAVPTELEDLGLGKPLLDHDRQHGFLALAEEIARDREKQRARQLLRQRAAAFVEAAGLDVAEDGPPDPDRVDAVVPVEAMILDGHHRVAQVG